MASLEKLRLNPQLQYRLGPYILDVNLPDEKLAIQVGPFIDSLKDLPTSLWNSRRSVCSSICMPILRPTIQLTMYPDPNHATRQEPGTMPKHVLTYKFSAVPFSWKTFNKQKVFLTLHLSLVLELPTQASTIRCAAE